MDGCGFNSASVSSQIVIIQSVKPCIECRWLPRGATPLTFKISLDFTTCKCLNPFAPTEFLIDELIHLALDRVKSISGTYMSERVKMEALLCCLSGKSLNVQYKTTYILDLFSISNFCS